MKDQKISSSKDILTILKLNDDFFNNLCDEIKFPRFSTKPEWNYSLTYSALKNDPELQELLKNILITEHFSCFQDDVVLSSKYLLIQIDNVIEYVEKKFPDKDDYIKVNQAYLIEYLVCQMITLRLYKEIRTRELPFPFIPDMKERRESILTNMYNKTVQYKKKPPPIHYGGTLPKTYVHYSKSISGFYSQQHFLKIKKNDADSSPIDLWNSSPQLLTVINSSLRWFIHLRRKNKETANLSDFRILHNSRHANDPLNYNFCYKDLLRTFSRQGGVSQFEPCHVPFIICFLENQYNTPITSLLDLCAGWGDRLVGAFISEPLGLTRYVGTDPNAALQSSYAQIAVECQEKIKLETVVYPKPMENLTEEELTPNNRSHQLMLTCPPYFQEEIYDGEEQSTTRYPDYETWKNQFLHTLMLQAIKGIELGGFVSVMIGNNKPYNIVDDLKNHINSTAALKYMGFFKTPSESSQEMIIARYSPGMGALQTNPLLPSPNAHQTPRSFKSIFSSSTTTNTNLNSPASSSHRMEEDEPLLIRPGKRKSEAESEPAVKKKWGAS